MVVKTKVGIDGTHNMGYYISGINAFIDYAFANLPQTKIEEDDDDEPEFCVLVLSVLIVSGSQEMWFIII